MGKLSNEIYRALGSLLYQNGPKLNEYNLNRLLVNNQSNENSNLLFKIRSQVENDLTALIKTNFANLNETKFELLNKLNLISTQLVFNLTIPVQLHNSSILGQDLNLSEYIYIEDKYKAKCASLMIKTLRFNNINHLSLAKNKNVTTYTENISKHFNSSANNRNNFLEDEFNFSNSKILAKALQGLENLFSAIKIDQPNQQSHWVQSSTEFQLGDILAIVKVFLKELKLIFK